MKTFATLALVLGALAAADPAAAQRTPEDEMRAAERVEAEAARQAADAEARQAEERGLEGLVGLRRELALTEQQVARLVAIQRELQARNLPLRQELERRRAAFMAERRAQIERLTPQQRRDTLRRLREEGRARQVPESMRPLIVQMRRNLELARDDAGRVLTDEQKVRARHLLREHARRMREHRDGLPRRPGTRAPRPPRGGAGGPP